MKFKKLNSGENYILAIFSVLMIIAVIYSTAWGYDEFGAVVSHLELNNPEFKNIYYSYVPNSIINIPFAKDLFDLFLGVFIVPIRWTYAVGLSPILGLVRYWIFDWELLKIIFLIIYLIIVIIGLKLIFSTIKSSGLSFANLFLSLMLLSTPFIYWTLTLTSYSHHLLCFGMILYANDYDKRSNDNKILSKKSVINSAIPFFNYQYIQIIFILGLIEIIRRRKNYFKDSLYKVWIIPGLSCLLLCLFLILRTNLSGKHGSPISSTMSSSLLISEHLSNPYDLIKFLYFGYLDIFSYFFPYSIAGIIFFYLFIFSIVYGITIIIFKLKAENYNLICISLILILGATILHFIGVFPISQSRHQILLLLPSITLVTLVVCDFLIKLFGEKLLISITLSLYIFTACYFLNNYISYKKKFPLNIIKEIILENNINTIILAPCNLEPLMNYSLRKNSKIIYRCGPKIVEKIDLSGQNLAFWITDVDPKYDISKYISEFLTNDPNLILKSEFLNIGGYPGKLYVYYVE